MCLSIIVSTASVTALRQLAFRVCADNLDCMRIERCGDCGCMLARVYLNDDRLHYRTVLADAVRRFFPDAHLLQA